MMEGKKAGKWIVKGGFVSMKKVSCVHTHNGARHTFLTAASCTCLRKLQSPVQPAHARLSLRTKIEPMAKLRLTYYLIRMSTFIQGIFCSKYDFSTHVKCCPLQVHEHDEIKLLLHSLLHTHMHITLCFLAYIQNNTKHASPVTHTIEPPVLFVSFVCLFCICSYTQYACQYSVSWRQKKIMECCLPVSIVSKYTARTTPPPCVQEICIPEEIMTLYSIIKHYRTLIPHFSATPPPSRSSLPLFCHPSVTLQLLCGAHVVGA